MEMQRGRDTSELWQKINEKIKSRPTFHHFISHTAALGQFSEKWIEETIYQYGSAYEPLRH